MRLINPWYVRMKTLRIQESAGLRSERRPVRAWGAIPSTEFAGNSLGKPSEDGILRHNKYFQGPVLNITYHNDRDFPREASEEGKTVVNQPARPDSGSGPTFPSAILLSR